MAKPLSVTITESLKYLALTPDEEMCLEYIVARYNRLSEIRTFNRTPFDESSITELTGADLKRASTPPRFGRVLFSIGKALAQEHGGKVKSAELGACAGISAMYLIAGFSFGGGGEFLSFEGIKENCDLTKTEIHGLIKYFGMKNISSEVVEGKFSITLPQYSNRMRGLHLAFVDGNHRAAPTWDYHRMFCQLMSPYGIIVHDDMNYSREMRAIWAQLKAYESNATWIELLRGGWVAKGIILRGKMAEDQCCRIHLDRALKRPLNFAKQLLSGFL